ncbi:glucosyltransferase, partial [Coemansia sp. RSA 2399]
YCVVPAYAYAMAAIHQSLEGTMLWRATFVACTAAALVPSPLLEFRYFTIPLIIARLHMAPAAFGMRRVAIEALWYCAINAATLWVFLNRPFAWHSEPGKAQRFMW